MADISAIKLPNGSTYDLVDKKSGYIKDVEVNGVSVIEDGIAEINLDNYVRNWYSEYGDSFITTDDGDSGARIRKSNNSTNKIVEMYWTLGEQNDSPEIIFTANHIGVGLSSWIPTNNTDFTTKKYVDDSISALPSPMLFKGSVGTGGTISTLPSATSSNEGFTYKVITDLSTPVTAKVGDTVISNGNAWVVIPSGDEPSGTVTSVGLSNATDGGLSISGSPITSSGTISIGHSNVLSSAQTTLGIYPIKIDKNGHISEYGTAVTIPTKTSDLTNDSNFMSGMTILRYGSSTWNDFLTAYQNNHVVYCRASSNANPASGAQLRLAFMAYVAGSDVTPTEVEFQYYRSVSSHTAAQQGDQVYVYKLTNKGVWSVTVREASVKVVAGTGLGGTYSNGTMTLTGPTKVSDLTNDSGFITSETDPVFSASAAAGITSSNISTWSGKQDALVSGTNIKTINNQSLLGSGDLVIQSGVGDVQVNGTSVVDENAIATVTVPTATSDLTNDSGFITGYTETDPVFTSSVAYGISSSDISGWNSKQNALVSGTNIKTVNNESLLGSGNIDIQSDNAFIVTFTYDNQNETWSCDKTTQEIYEAYESGVAVIGVAPEHYEETGYEETYGYLYPLYGCGKIEEDGTDTFYYATFMEVRLNGFYPNANVYSSELEIDGDVITQNVRQTSIVSTARKINNKSLSADITLTASDVGAQPTLVSGTNIKTINNTSLLGSGNIDIQSGSSIFVAEYGVTTYADVSNAYNNGATLLCERYIDGVTYLLPLFAQYEEGYSFYFGSGNTNGFISASVSRTGGWQGSTISFATKDTATTSKNGLMSSSDKSKLDGIASGAEVNVNADWDAVSGDAQILNKPTIPSKTSDLTNDSGFITGYTETDPIFGASAAAGITSSNISSWNGKQDALVSGTNIKTINNQSLLGSGDISITSSSTSVPTANETAEFDSSAKMNSTNMTSSEVTDFVESLDISGGGGGSVPTFNTATITLTTAGWSNNSQTVTVQGVTASNIVIVNPAPASYDEYVVDNVRCTGQSANSLTFTCDFVPNEAITVSVIITSVTAVYGGEVS